MRITVVIAASFLIFADTALATTISVFPFGNSSTFRFVFISSQETGITSGDIADYNSFVTDIARGSSIESELRAVGVTDVTWNAWVSTATHDARDNVRQGAADDVPIVNARGELIALGWNQLFSETELPPIVNNIGYDENGAFVNDGAITGTNVFGRKFGADVCVGCTRVVGGSANIHSGVQNDPDEWTSAFITKTRPESEFRIYAFSSPITVRISAPSTMALFLLGLVALRASAIRLSTVKA